MSIRFDAWTVVLFILVIGSNLEATLAKISFSHFSIPNRFCQSWPMIAIMANAKTTNYSGNFFVSPPNAADNYAL